MSSLKHLLSRIHFAKLNLSLPGMNLELEFADADKDAAWALYVELITRSAIQPLSVNDGSEAAALKSIYSIFPTTREILKQYGRRAKSFSQIAIIVLNGVLRPFTSKWHKRALNGELKDDPEAVNQFRNELSDLQCDLLTFVEILAEIAEFNDVPFFQIEGGIEHDF